MFALYCSNVHKIWKNIKSATHITKKIDPQRSYFLWRSSLREFIALLRGTALFINMVNLNLILKYIILIIK